MKHILLTGGAGYIGSALIPKLLQNSYRVRILDQFYFGSDHIKPYQNSIEIIKQDICKIKPSIFQNIDTIIHLAAFSNDPMANFAPELNYQVNTIATTKLAQMAKRTGVKRFIFASSCSIYHQGIKNSHIKTEASPVNPKEYYSKSKFLAEKSILPLSDKNFTVVCLRKGTVSGYSPRLRFDLAVNTMVKTALTSGKIIVYDGNQHRPMIDIQDVVSAYIITLTAPKEKINSQIFNLANKNYTMLELAKKVAKALQDHTKKYFPIEIKPKIRDRTYRVSAKKIKQTLRFTPKHTIHQSVTNLLDHITKQPSFNFSNPLYYNIDRMKQIFKTSPQQLQSQAKSYKTPPWATTTKT